MTDDIYTSLSNFEPLDIEWLWYPLIPYGMVTILEGDPGIGKSFGAMKLASIVSTGGTLPNGQRVKRNGVLYISAEDDPNYTIRPRIDAMGGDPDLIRLQEKYSPFDDHGLKILRREVRKHPVGLIAIDPLYAYVPSSSDMYKPNEIRALMAQLSELAAEIGAAVVIIRHLRKSKSDKAIYQGIGAIDVIAAARSAILAAKHPDDPKMVVLAHLKHNLSERGESWGYTLTDDPQSEIPKFEWTGKVPLTADDLFGTTPGLSALEMAIEFLQAELVTPKAAVFLIEKAQACSISSRTLDRAKKELGVVVEKQGISWMWTLPPKDRQGRQK